MQKYKENTKIEQICSISGYAWLILNINQEAVGTRLDLSRSYIKHIPMFREYLSMLSNGDKKDYIYHLLGDKYRMHPSSVKRVIFKLLQVVKV